MVPRIAKKKGYLGTPSVSCHHWYAADSETRAGVHSNASYRQGLGGAGAGEWAVHADLAIVMPDDMACSTICSARSGETYGRENDGSKASDARVCRALPSMPSGLSRMIFFSFVFPGNDGSVLAGQ